MKPIFVLFFALMIFTAHAQDTYMQKTASELDSTTAELTAQYSKKISLTGKQELLFKKKLEEFILEKETVENSLSGKDKLDKLYQIGQQENAEMRDILSQKQYDLYVRIKPSLQPLEKVEIEN